MRNHAIFWGFVCLALIGLAFLFQQILLPFVLGITIAYLLNPLVERLRGDKGSRRIATLIILLSFAMLLFFFFAALFPVLYKEALDLFTQAPDYIADFMRWLRSNMRKLDDVARASGARNMQELMGDNTDGAAVVAGAGGMAMGIVTGGLAIIDFISIVVITPIVAYFMILEWPRIIAWVDGMLPRHNRETILGLLKEIDKKLSGFVRGQISISVILGMAYALALTLAGLKYGFLIGIATGVLSIIPLVGSTTGLVTSVGVAWVQSNDITYVLIIAAIFAVGQIIEGNFLTPKIVGNGTGLHPLWVFFALLAGGSLMGITGMLIAVPVAAIISVLCEFMFQHYKKSAYYKDPDYKPPVKTRKTVIIADE